MPASTWFSQDEFWNWMFWRLLRKVITIIVNWTNSCTTWYIPHTGFNTLCNFPAEMSLTRITSFNFIPSLIETKVPHYQVHALRELVSFVFITYAILWKSFRSLNLCFPKAHKNRSSRQVASNTIWNAYSCRIQYRCWFHQTLCPSYGLILSARWPQTLDNVYEFSLSYKERKHTVIFLNYFS